jgi:hypothetical protein
MSVCLRFNSSQHSASAAETISVNGDRNMGDRIRHGEQSICFPERVIRFEEQTVGFSKKKGNP